MPVLSLETRRIVGVNDEHRDGKGRKARSDLHGRIHWASRSDRSAPDRPDRGERLALLIRREESSDGLDGTTVSDVDRAKRFYSEQAGRGGDWNSFVFFSDPDGNGWAIQERPAHH